LSCWRAESGGDGEDETSASDAKGVEEELDILVESFGRVVGVREKVELLWCGSWVLGFRADREWRCDG